MYSHCRSQNREELWLLRHSARCLMRPCAELQKPTLRTDIDQDLVQMLQIAVSTAAINSNEHITKNCPVHQISSLRLDLSMDPLDLIHRQDLCLLHGCLAWVHQFRDPFQAPACTNGSELTPTQWCLFQRLKPTYWPFYHYIRARGLGGDGPEDIISSVSAEFVVALRNNRVSKRKTETFVGRMITAMTNGCAAEHVEMSCNDWCVRSCGILPSSLLFHISRGRISVPSFRRLGIG